MSQPTSSNTSKNELTVLRRELSEQRQELCELRQAFAALRSNGHYSGKGALLEAAESTVLTDRRGMLKKVGALAAGIAAASLLRPASSGATSPSPRKSIDGTEGGGTMTGDPLLLGQSNTSTGTDRTSIFHSANDLSATVFRVDNYDVTALGDPPAGDHTAILAHINNNGSATTAGDLYALFAVAEAPDGGTAVAVHGEGDDIGVRGIAVGSSGCGVAGFADVGTSAHAVDGSSATGVGGAFNGARAAVFLSTGVGAIANPITTPPGGATTGDLYRGTAGAGLVGAGSLWYRTGGTPEYVRLADQTTVGALTLLPAPQRLVDTRNGSGFFDAGNHYVNDTLRLYNIRTLATPDLPDGVRGIIGRISVVGATASGVIQESPNPPVMGNDLGQGTAVVNYPSAAVLPSFGATFVSALNSAGQIRVRGFMAGGGTVDVIIDITGYYL